MRFTMRRMMFAVGIMAGFLFLVSSLFEAVWVGRATIPLEFVILDDSTGKPIRGASIWLTEGTPEYRATADSNGRAKLLIRATVAGHSSRVRSTRAVNYGSWRLVVAGGGFDLNADLRMLTKDARYHYDATPPPIVIRLKRGSAKL